MKHIMPIAATIVLSACATSPHSHVNVASQRSLTNDTVAYKLPEQQPASVALSQVTANEYARVLVHELMAQHNAVNEGGMVGVTDFAFVDSGLDQGSVLSNHLSEAIMYDLHKFGVAVLDFKVTDYIRVTPGGDFALSRDFTELSAELPIRFVVTGTMTSHELGILINARLIRIDNKQVISAARTFMPKQVANAIISRSGSDRLQLKQG
ncbi:FlgO family outer membrane protein [Rheinheimera sp.]|uniref:FlgO family outer membrane protein n=1 Tax=Rheinheimera sp. TaxID=1869214 RepID=UPI0040476C3F